MNLPSSELKRLSFSFRTWHVFCVFIALVFNQSVIDKAHAHSGGLNAQGCHAGSQDYHCHSGGSSGSGRSVSRGTSFNSMPTRSAYPNAFKYSQPSLNNSSKSGAGQNSLCPKNYFTELLRQADTGRIHIECEGSYMVIRSE